MDKILIYTTQRTGSNLLDLVLCKSYGLEKPENELFLDDEYRNIDNIDHVIDYYDRKVSITSPLILRLMHFQLDRMNESQLLRFKNFINYHGFWTIRLTRNDLKNNILSLYIASISNEFGYQSKNKVYGDFESFKKIFNTAYNNYINLKKNVYNLNIDQEVDYSDFINNRGIIIGNKRCNFLANKKYVEVSGVSVKSWISLPKEEKLSNFIEVERWYDELLGLRINRNEV